MLVYRQSQSYYTQTQCNKSQFLISYGLEQKYEIDIAGFKTFQCTPQAFIIIVLLYCHFSLFLSTQGRVKIHFHALRPCSSLTLCAESGLWLRNALNVSSVIISLLFYITAADSLRMLCLTDALMLYLLLSSQNGFVAENERVIPNMALTLR